MIVMVQFDESLGTKEVACVGAGVMGHSWATLFAIKGHRIWLQDISNENLDRALRWIEEALLLFSEKGLIGKREADSAFDRVKPTTNLTEAVSHAGFVIESVTESYEEKKQVFREMDEAAPKETILASGSSGLLMTEIQKATDNPERCIGAHGFNPPHLIPLVELVPGEATSEQTVKRTFQLMERLGKVPIIVKKEVAWYLGNRMQNSVFQAAYDIVDSGIASVEDVDLAMSTGLGIRWALYGPFLVSYFNTPSHLGRRRRTSGLVAKGYENYSLLKGRSFDDMVRWRNDRLIDVLRVLGHLLAPDTQTFT